MVKKRFISVICSLMIMLMIPFSILADETVNTVPFVGINIRMTAFDHQLNSLYTESSYLNSKKIVGAISGTLDCSSPSTPTSSAPCDVFTFKGNTTAGTSISLTLSDNNKEQYETDVNTTMNRLWEVEFILDDSYVGYVVFNDGNNNKTIYVNGTSFTQTYWNSSASMNLNISIIDYDLHRNSIGSWYYPIESFKIIQEFWNRGYEQIGIQKYVNYMFPVFQLHTNDRAFSVYLGSQNSYTMVFLVDKNIGSVSAFLDHFHFGTDTQNLYEFTNLQVLSPTIAINNGNGYLVNMTFKNNGSSSKTFNIYASEDVVIMPVYGARSSERNMQPSIDFALNFGLRNEVLDNLNIISNGTSGSNQSSDNLGSSANQMNNQMQDLINTEDSYNQQFNNSLQNIDFTSPTGNQSLLSSANFVITVFNGLIQNNFLSKLIIIICILIIGKKVIGK